jgi:hypothetical protein
MKANKALKRLAKIEAWMSDVMERYSASAPDLRKVLQDAKAAVARAKEAVGLQAPSGKKAAAKADRAAKKAALPERKAAVKKAAVKAPTAKTAKKSKPIKKAAKNRAAKKTAPAPVVQAATKAVAQ